MEEERNVRKYNSQGKICPLPKETDCSVKMHEFNLKMVDRLPIIEMHKKKKEIVIQRE